MTEQNGLTEKYSGVYAALTAVYGTPQWRRHAPPVDALVGTILSQATSDINQMKGFNALRDRYPSWEAVLHAPPDEIVETIRSAGLANQKGPRIQLALRTIRERRGEINLDFLADLPLDEAMDWLTSIKGIGPKTAAIILLFSFGRPAFPVDTHVHRICKRLGLIGPRVSATRAHKLLPQLGAPETFYPIHLNFIRHGRAVCKAQNPRCPDCVLQQYCDYFAAQQQLSGGKVEKE